MVNPSAAVLLAGVATALVGAGLLLIDTKRPVHRDPSGLPEWLGLIALLLGAFGTGMVDSQASLEQQGPFFVTFCAGGIVVAVAKDRCNRARHAVILGRVVDTLGNAAVSGDKMTGRFRRRAVEVLLSEGGVNEYASMTVVLKDCSGPTDWYIQYGRLPRRWRSKDWQVKSQDPALADRLTKLGAPTLVQRRYVTAAGRCWKAELQPPSVCYSAKRCQLRYSVAVGGTTMDTLSPERLRALLDLLWKLAQLNERVDGKPAPGQNGSRPAAPA